MHRVRAASPRRLSHPADTSAAGAVANALVGDTLRCSIPIRSITPEQIFTKMEAARESVGIRDWGVANASLEDVFIQVNGVLCVV